MPKLLLADDSVTIQRVIELTFSNEDVQVVTASDGEQAIARISGERPDIVLADIGMPKRSGYDVAAFVKSQPQLSHIPVLLLAGAFEPVDQIRAAEVRCDGVLVKPFDPQQVIARVKELVGGAQGSPTSVVGEVPRPVDGLSASRAGERPVPPLAAASRTAGAPAPSFPAGPPGTGGTVAPDDFLGQLDAAFQFLGEDPSPRLEPAADTEPERELPTLDRLLEDVDDAALPARETAGPALSEPSIADTFAALLAAEQGELAPGAPQPQTEPTRMSEDFLDEVARRVLERLTPGAVTSVVKPIVSEMAERLLREEIERMRRKR